MPLSYFETLPINQPKSDEVKTCIKCHCQWMELILVEQFPAFSSSVVGQKPQSKGGIGFYLFRCPKCLELYEPSVLNGAQDASRKLYDLFLDQLEAPLPTGVESPAEKILKGEKV